MPSVVRLLVLAGLAACSGGSTGDVPAPPVFPPAPAPVPGMPPPAEPVPPPPPPIGPAPSFADPELARRVEHLATFSRIESSHVGAAGAPSPAFAAFAAVRERATPDDLVALLRHPSPVVRGYAGQHVAREVPAALPAALLLLGDATPVGTVEGCMMGEGTVGGVVSAALCYSRQPAAIAEVARLAREGSPRSAWAMACVGQGDPRAAAELALSRLRTGQPAGTERASLLRLVGNGVLGPAGCEVLVGASSAFEPDVRVASAQGLAECADPGAVDALRRLSGDLDATVSRIARTELALHVSLSPAEREALLADPGVATRASVQLSFRMGRGGFARLAERYRAISTSHPDLSWNGLASQPASEPALGLARAVAAAAPVGTNARRDAMGQISRNGDARDLPEIRRSLDSTNVSEVIDALEAVGRLRDRASLATVQRLRSHANASVSRTATATLGRL